MTTANTHTEIHQLARNGKSKSAHRRNLLNSIFFWFCMLVTSIAVILLTVLITTIAVRGWDGLTMDFLQNFGSRNPESAGIKAALWGSVWICAVCGLVALPVGVATAIYLEEFAPKNRLTSFIRTNISNLAGVPSIVYGIIGLTIFARMFGLPGLGTETDPGLTLGSTWHDTYYASDGSRLELPLADRNSEPKPLADGDKVLMVEETDASLVDATPLPIRLVEDGFDGLYAVADPDPIKAEVTKDSLGPTVPGELSEVRSMNPSIWRDAKVYLSSQPMNQANLEDAPSLSGRWMVTTDRSGDTMLFPCTGQETSIAPGSSGYLLRSTLPAITSRENLRSHRTEAIDVQKGTGGPLIKDQKWVAYKVLNRVPTRYVIVEAPKSGEPDRLVDWQPVYPKQSNTFVETGMKTLAVKIIPDDATTTSSSTVFASDAAKPMAGERNERRAWYYFQLPFGKGVLAGGLTLMLVILPIVIIASIEALRAVPNSLRQASLAMGATPWQTVRQVTLPASIPMIMTGSILAMSRAIGEAAPILVLGVALFITRTPQNLMDQFTILPMQVYNWGGRPQSSFQDLAATGIIVLLAVLLTFNVAAILIRQRLQKPLQ
jgi:ABC-type phosphate transport system permease subunit